MKYIFFDENGNITERHNDLKIKKPPKNSIVINDKEWDIPLHLLKVKNNKIIILPEKKELIQKNTLISDAHKELRDIDKLTLRCYQHGISFPFEWKKYLKDLEDIVSGKDKKSLVLPTKPEYPDFPDFPD
jgi:hypothetical protein